MPLLGLGAIIVMLLIGLRFRVGGDWGQYERMFAYVGRVSLGRALNVGDPGYQFLNWVVQQMGGGIWLVNLICGAIFCWGLFRLARLQPNPWLAIVVAVPYLIVVVAMGYTRQAVAIGILMAGLASTDERGINPLRFAAYVFVAALFHRTAVALFPLVALASRRNFVRNGLTVLAAAVLLFSLFLRDTMDRFVSGYVVAEQQSEGAAVRLAMNALPSLIVVIARYRLGFSKEQYIVWRNISFGSFALAAAFIVLPSSTVVDRLSLYMIPIQLVVLSRIPLTIGANKAGELLMRLSVVFYSAMILYIWLNYAVHAYAWVPYQFYPT